MKILFLVVCAVLISYISVKFALVSKDILDIATSGSKSSFLKESIIYLVVLVVLQLICQIAYTLVLLHTENKYRFDLRLKIYSSLLLKKTSALSKYHTGEILNRLNSDVSNVTSSVLSIVPNVFSFVSRIVIAFSALFMLDKTFALIFVVIGPLFMLVARLYSKKVKPLYKKSQELHGKSQSFIMEIFQNLDVVKSFGVFKKVNNKLSGLQKDNLKVIMKRGYLSIFANVLFYISLTIGYYFAVAWCGYKIATGIMTVGTFAAIIQLVSQVQNPFKELANVVPSYYSMIASSERIMELDKLDAEDIDTSSYDYKKIYDDLSQIELENVSFAYENDEYVLNGVNAVFKKGMLNTICGQSGAGKTTILKLITGIIEANEGNISLVDKDGVKIKLTPSLRPLFAYVPQGNMMLSGTIKENIAFMDEDVKYEKLVSSAKTACIFDVINELPKGFDTPLSELGTGLSQGQIQRLSVARALYFDFPILLLDESTSALDADTEIKLIDNLKSLKDKTIIIISHRQYAISKSDNIIYIEEENNKKMTK